MQLVTAQKTLLDLGLRVVVIAGCLTAAIYALTLARAAALFRQMTASGVAAAVRLIPSNSTYVAALAEFEPPRRVELLQRALSLSRFDAKSWTQLGLDAEFRQHDAAKAERYFKEAAAVDHMFLPRLTLANFYFRQERNTEFLDWVHRALDISPYGYDPRPLYQECWSSGADPAHIAAAIPDYDRRLFEYAYFLLTINRPDLTRPVFERGMAAFAHSRSMPGDEGWYRESVGNGIDHLLDADLPDDALKLWGSLYKAGWIGLPVPAADSLLNNSDFSQQAFQHGFDWRLPPVQGASTSQFPDIREVRFTLSGTQPEFCILLQQYLVLQPLHRYELSWDSDRGTIPAEDGFNWRLYSVKRGVPPTPTDLRSPDVTAGTGDGKWEFRTAKEARVYLITLEYTRPVGKTRAEGSFVLRHAMLRTLQ